MVLISWVWRISKGPEPLKWNFFQSQLYWDNWCWSGGAKKSTMIKKRPASLRWNFLGSVSLGTQRCHDGNSWWQPNLFMCKSHWSYSEKAWRGLGEQVRLGTVWQGWNSQREAQRDHWLGATSVAVETLRLRRSWREVGSWQHMTGSESLKRDEERRLRKVQPSFTADHSILDKPVGMITEDTAAM